MEDIQLVVSDIFKCASVPRNCIRAIPLPAKAKLQKLVIGDESGNVTMISMAESDAASVESKFQHSQKEVGILELAIQPTGEKDRVFFSTGSMVFGLTKKLKDFIKFDTQLADIVKHLVVEGTYLFIAGEYLLNQYQMLNDQVTPQSFFLCPDKINDMAAHYITGQSKVNIILACQDSCIRVLYNDDVQYEVVVSAPVSCMQVFSPEYKEISSLKRIEQRKCFIYGLEDGTVMVIDMTMVKGIVLMQFKVQGSGINHLRPCDFFRTGLTDLLVVRNDSVIELYSLDETQMFELRASRRVNETITGVDAGWFKSNINCEFALSTFSGRVLLLKSNDDYSKRGFESKRDDKKLLKEQELKLKQLKSDIAKLEQQFTELKGKSDKDTGGVIYANQFKVSARLIKQSTDGTYNWIIESQYSIEMVTVQSSVRLEILNSEPELVVSFVEGEKSTSVCLRVKDQHRKTLEIKFRAQEGEAGILNAFIVPDAVPQTAQMVATEIKPLSLHSKVSDVPKGAQMCTLNLKGSFTKNYMNMWVNALVPDVPNNSEEDTVTYLFRNVFTDTILSIKYKQGQAVIKSDSVTTIAICKQFIVEQANSRGIQIDVKWDVNDQSVQDLLRKLMLKFTEHQRLEQAIKILPALKELKASENDLSYLSKEFQDTLANEEQLIKEHQKLPKRINFLTNTIVDIYNSRCLLKGSKPNPQKQEYIRTQVILVIIYFQQINNYRMAPQSQSQNNEKDLLSTIMSL